MKKRIVLVTAAVLLAVLGTFVVYSYGKSADKRALAGTKSTSVLIVTKRIPAGTTWSEAVKGDYFSAQNYPSGSVPSSAVLDAKTAAIGGDAVAQADIAPGQFVLREAFGTKTAQTGALTIPKGLIAVSFAFGGPNSVAGYVGPGAEVVIFMTSVLVKSADQKPVPGTQGDSLKVTKTLVARAEVIATSSTPVTKTAGGGDNASSDTSGTTVTVALTQRDSERVILGQSVGELYLGLLSPSSQVSADDPGVMNVGKFQPALIFVK